MTLKYPIELLDTKISVKELPSLLIKIFPEWQQEKIVIKPVSGGITNMLIKCTYNSRDSEDVVLVRSYGNNTELIIDRINEFNNHLLLNKLNLAPCVYAKFANGIVYGYLSGRSLTPDELYSESLFPLIAQKLGYWHTLITQNSKDMNANDLWDTIDKWIKIMPELPNVSQRLAQILHVDDVDVKECLSKELAWVKEVLHNKSVLVKSHCDLLSGNIVIPPELFSTEQREAIFSMVHANSKYNFSLPRAAQNPIQFIDYEYMLSAPRGFDIANHLAEWQGFDCEKEKIPKPTKDNQILRRWCYCYLLGGKEVNFGEADEQLEVLEADIDQLIDEISSFFGIPGFYWGVWAAIQSEISSIDFDYSNYSINRLEEYFDWKRVTYSA